MYGEENRQSLTEKAPPMDVLGDFKQTLRAYSYTLKGLECVDVSTRVGENIPLGRAGDRCIFNIIFYFTGKVKGKIPC